MRAWRSIILLFGFSIAAISADAAPMDFSGDDLRETTGQKLPIKISTADSEHLVVLFLSAKCPCSMSHLDEIRSLTKDFPDIKFLAINSNKDESREMGIAYFSHANLSFPVLRDDNLNYADLLKAVKTPHAFVLDKNGKIIFQGGVSDSAKFPNAKKRYLRDALTDLQLKRPIRVPLARALGCAINRGE